MKAKFSLDEGKKSTGSVTEGCTNKVSSLFSFPAYEEGRRETVGTTVDCNVTASNYGFIQLKPRPADPRVTVRLFLRFSGKNWLLQSHLYGPNVYLENLARQVFTVINRSVLIKKMLHLDMVLLLPCVLYILTEHVANGLVGALLVVQIVVETLNLEISRHLAD